MGPSLNSAGRRVGPHVCLSGFGSGCCPGWMPSPASGQCTLPLCSFGCGSGWCIAPNVCSCRDGEQGITCPDLPGACGEYGCDLACNHGGCREVARVCPLGFSMVETTNGVRCTDIDECLSASCQGLCVNTEGGFVCECGPGLRLAADRHSCQDTDECLATPCQHRCKNSVGSYRCFCRPGYHLHSNQHSCLDVNECRRASERRPCQHACHNGPPGYRLSGDRVSCEGKEPCRVACSHPLPLKDGGCCPSCSGCWHEGVARAEGDVFSVADGNCTVCMCLAGNISCISPECPPGLCLSPAQADCCSCQPATCDFHGRTYVHGAEFSLDGDNCTTCVCRGGEVECSFVPCPELACPRQDWLLAPGHCCFSCREPAPVSGCFVDDNGVEFPIGQIWSPGDPCEFCICQANGSVSCKRTDCLETCPHPIQIPGQCCPDCSAGCTYMGRIFYNNETFPSALDPCLSCICLLGSVACSPVDCIVFCVYPFHPEGECCPVCYDCNYEGRKVVNGQTFVPEGEPCIRCTCQLGEVSCEKRPCTRSCTEPSAPPAACCPACQDTPVLLESSPVPVQVDDAEPGKSLPRNPRENSMSLPRASDCHLCPSPPGPASPSPERRLLAGRNVIPQDAGPVNTPGPLPSRPGSFGSSTAPPGPSLPPTVLMETSGPTTAPPSPDQPPSSASAGPSTAPLALTQSPGMVPAPQKHSTLPSEGAEPSPQGESTPSRPAP
nr:von Willebrand factor C and EGF domain-containing protein [Pelodiscus sinensis]|eukprot:XP_025043419.1 von Willebrand factor C and EGF domain-containing protein [Pelodiscus sinensis]